MPAYLIAEEGPLTGLIIHFEEGNEWVLGRDPDETDQTLEDPMVSRKHVICRLTAEGYLLENLSAVNPATQNGLVITEPVLLREGDIIQIGSTFFRFTEQALESPSTPTPWEEPFHTENRPSSFDLSPEKGERWMLKVISGPNTGAEFSLGKGGTYIAGKDPSTCDIVFQDLSVSRQHAKITLTEEGQVFIEDLGSRNGILINGDLVQEKKELTSQDLLSLGTTSLLIIDREDTKETIYSPPPFFPGTSPLAISQEPLDHEKTSSIEPIAPTADWKEMVISKKHLVVGGGFVAFLLVVFLSMFALFSSRPVALPSKHPSTLIQEALIPYPSVQFSWNEENGKLFLVGHVLTNINHQELSYTLAQLPFIQSTEDNIVVDEYVWQNMNALLSTNPSWQAISIHSPLPGKFVMRGYLQDASEAQALQDYMNRNFPYLDRLDNQVVVESILSTQIQGMLASGGYYAVAFQLSNGELILSGKTDANEKTHFQELIETFKGLSGIRLVKNFVVFSSADSSRTDLSGKYQVSGASMKDGKAYNIVINGKILAKGDMLDGMLITAIESDMVLLEKDGSKFKINYNLQ